MDIAFLNHSYVRIREIGSGRVVVNVPKSQATTWHLLLMRSLDISWH